MGSRSLAKFSLNEWEELISSSTDSSKKRFLVKFDNSLSFKLQNLGLKCWLRSSTNRFKKKVLWEGNYFCIDSTCGMKFKCRAKQLANQVSVHVYFSDSLVSHDKIVKKLRISGVERTSQQYSLVVNGILNTQSFNQIYNSSINDPSMIH